MRRNILAMYKHIASTDDAPDHDSCDATICKFNIAIAREDANDYDHSKHFHIPSPVMAEVKAIFEELANVGEMRTRQNSECQRVLQLDSLEPSIEERFRQP